MRAWISRIGIFLGWSAYDYYRMGYHSMPEIGDNDFPLVFDSGYRVIMERSEDKRFAEKVNRREYLFAAYLNTPEYFKDAWSRCKAPAGAEAREIEKSSAAPGPGMRLEAVCTLDADGEILRTGIVYSIPDL